MIPKQNLSFGKKRSFGIVPKVPHEIINIRNHHSRAKRKFLLPLIIQLLDQIAGHKQEHHGHTRSQSCRPNRPKFELLIQDLNSILDCYAGWQLIPHPNKSWKKFGLSFGTSNQLSHTQQPIFEVVRAISEILKYIS